tara:strand:- start:1432 stop:1551 length:120 start_codon:yes stop_codon:yes gene_type:complete
LNPAKNGGITGAVELWVEFAANVGVADEDIEKVSRVIKV